MSILDMDLFEFLATHPLSESDLQAKVFARLSARRVKNRSSILLDEKGEKVIENGQARGLALEMVELDDNDQPQAEPKRAGQLILGTKNGKIQSLFLTEQE